MILCYYLSTYFGLIFRWNEISIHVPSNQVRLIVGRGGDTVRKLEKDTGAKITIENSKSKAAQRDYP